MSDVVRGVSDAVRGASYLAARPRLWVWIVLPALVSLALLVGIIAGAIALAEPLLERAVAYVPSGYASWAEGGATVILAIVLGAVGFTVFLSAAALIAAPFNEMLSEAIEAQLTGRPGEPFRPVRFVIDVVVGVFHALRRIAIYLVLIAALFVVSVVVPVIGAIVATALGAYVTARFASYDAYDAVWARKRWRYRDKTAYLSQRRWRTIGLGAAIGGLTLVPGLNLVALSIGAAGATLAFLAEERGAASVAPRP
jgi:CysZ protein